jgi:hypothetical protein
MRAGSAAIRDEKIDLTGIGGADEEALSPPVPHADVHAGASKGARYDGIGELSAVQAHH